MTRTSQAGSAMLVTLIIIAALLAGAAVVVSVQISASRSTQLTRSGMTSLYCAEAGGTAAAQVVANNYPLWASTMCTAAAESACLPASAAAEPGFLAPPAINYDLDGDGSADFVIYLRDDDDETGVQDRASDKNQRVFVVSTCTKFPDTPTQVRSLVTFSGGGTCYGGQIGGCGGNNNGN